MEVGIGEERKIKWPQVAQSRNDIGALHQSFSLGVGDEGSFEKAADDWGCPIPNSVVAFPLGDAPAIENVFALGVNGSAAETRGEIRSWEDIQV